MFRLSASPVWEVRLVPFRSLFTQPGFGLFCAFVREAFHQSWILDGY
jgi:hypothetical protein